MTSNETLKMVVIFDFDGVIVDSNAWKWIEAWREVFRDEPYLLEVMGQLLAKDAEKKLTRIELIEQLFEDLEKKNYTPFCVKEDYLKRYGKIVREGVLRIGLFDGIPKVLAQLEKRGCRMYIISATPQEDLDYISQRLNIANFFCALYGFPGLKKEHGQEVARREGHQATYVVIGDGEGDRTLAKEIGARFIGVSNRWNGWRQSGSFEVVSKVDEILDLISF